MDGPRLAAGLSQRLQSGLEQVGVVRESSSNARVACPTESRGNSQADWRRTRSRSGVAGNFSTHLGAFVGRRRSAGDRIRPECDRAGERSEVGAASRLPRRLARPRRQRSQSRLDRILSASLRLLSLSTHSLVQCVRPFATGLSPFAPSGTSNVIAVSPLGLIMNLDKPGVELGRQTA